MSVDDEWRADAKGTDATAGGISPGADPILVAYLERLGPARFQLACRPLTWLSEPMKRPPPEELAARGPDGREHRFRITREGATWTYGRCEAH